MINQKNQFIGQVCHIKAARLGGERYDIHQSDEDRRGYENLILLCCEHHIETNDELEFTPEKMKAMKLEHEKNFLKNDYKINETALYKIAEEMEQFWEKVEKSKSENHVDPDMALSSYFGKSFAEVVNDTYQRLEFLGELTRLVRETNILCNRQINYMELKHGDYSEILKESPHYQPFEIENWEIHDSGIPNILMVLEANIIYLELKYLEAYLKLSPNDSEERNLGKIYHLGDFI